MANWQDYYYNEDGTKREREQCSPPETPKTSSKKKEESASQAKTLADRTLNSTGIKLSSCGNTCGPDGGAAASAGPSGSGTTVNVGDAGGAVGAAAGAGGSMLGGGLQGLGAILGSLVGGAGKAFTNYLNARATNVPLHQPVEYITPPSGHTSDFLSHYALGRDFPREGRGFPSAFSPKRSNRS